MRVFIAGATGTLGIPLVRELVGRGNEVIGLTRTETKRPLLERLGAQAAVADALDEEALVRVVRDARPDSVVHVLTAIPKQGPTRAADMTMTNRLRTAGTEYLLRASAAAGVKRIVAESVIFVYGFGDQGDIPKKEDDPLRPAMPLHGTKATVDAARTLESRVIGANRNGATEGIVLRFGLLYGPGVPATGHALQLLRERRIPVIGRGEGAKSWIHIDDAVAAIVAALERGRGGELYNIADDRPASYRDYLLSAASAVGAPPPRSVPLWFLRLTAPFAASMLSTRLAVSNEKAKQELGWRLRFADIHEGLKDLAAGEGREKEAA